MTTYTTRPPEPQQGDLDPAAHETRRRTSPVLLGALAIALVAFAVWWTSQRDTAGDAVAPAVVETTPPPAAPAMDEPRRDARVAGTARNERSRTLPADRGPQPLTGNPMPEYPRTTLRSGAEGTVLLSIQVDASGAPVDVQVVRRTGDRDRNFDRAAIQAVRNWRFEPAIRDGKAVSSTVQLPVDFRRG